MAKHRSSLSSPRLQKVLDVLRAQGFMGASTLEIQLAAMVTDVKDVIYELKHNGVEIESEWERGYKRYYLRSDVRIHASRPPEAGLSTC